MTIDSITVPPKIPNLFRREMRDGLFRAIPELSSPDLGWVLEGLGQITLKLDGHHILIQGYGADRKVYRKVLDTNSPTGESIYIECASTNEFDKPVFAAIQADFITSPGVYELIGPNIMGNPHNVPRPMMFRVISAESKLMVFAAQHNVKRGYNVSVQAVFDAIKAELAHPDTNVEGIVFHREVWSTGKCDVLSLCKVKRRDFGLSWPIVKTP